MTIHPRPDQEIKIQEALQSGLINTAEDLIDAGLERASSGARPPHTLKDVFDAVRGLADDVDFCRNVSIARRAVPRPT